ncbi:MAG: hypothetical protein RRY79_06195 [Clostridia bacterium]
MKKRSTSKREKENYTNPAACRKYSVPEHCIGGSLTVWIDKNCLSSENAWQSIRSAQ